MNSGNECEGVPNLKRYYHLMYFNRPFTVYFSRTFPVVWELLEHELTEECYACCPATGGLWRRRNQRNKYNMAYQRLHQSDYCLHMVFNHLWYNQPEPLKSLHLTLSEYLNKTFPVVWDMLEQELTVKCLYMLLCYSDD